MLRVAHTYSSTFHTLPATCASLIQELTAAGIAIAPLTHDGDANPVDAIWGSERPAPPQEPLRIHPIEYAGETVREKLDKVGTHRLSLYEVCF